MRRHPTPGIEPPIPPPPAGAKRGIQVQSAIALIEPFLVSGGANYFLDFDAGNVRQSGTQMITSVYVPRGRVGFVKQIRCAPFMPTVFSDPWNTSGAAGGAATWRGFNNDAQTTLYGDEPIRPGGQHGVWETPFGWEAYVSFQDGGLRPVPPASFPTWRWSLRLLQGGVDLLRQNANNLPPTTTLTFDGEGDVTNTPGELFCVPDIAVPTNTVYPHGNLPGTAPGAAFASQRMQYIQSDPLETHILIPEDTSAVLYAQWDQTPAQVRARDQNGTIVYSSPTYPLLPSFGSLHGYMQSSIAAQTLSNAQNGWGG